MKYLFLGFIPLMLASAAQAGTNCDEVRENEKTCLACNIYHEARGESEAGQVAVGKVTIQRVQSDRYPNTICKVVWQKSQFSWTNDGRSDIVKDQDSWRIAKQIADLVYLDHTSESFEITVGKEFDPNTLWYHNNTVNPHWAKSKKLVSQVGNHKFYKGD